MNLLVLSSDYPSECNTATLHYVHVRNKFYLKKGVGVTVINFKAKQDYVIDNIQVITTESYSKTYKNKKYDILLSHAPNLKSHYRFLTKYEYRFKKLVFFFHGHEILRIKDIYPKPYEYMRKNAFVSNHIQDIYDSFKLYVWKKFYMKMLHKSYFIFVSKWMYHNFLKYTGIDKDLIEEKFSITYNAIDYTYEINNYDIYSNKKYDFITIRSILDGSKYCIDLLCRLAENNPNYKFLLIGRGKFFDYYKIPSNIEWIDRHLKSNDIIEYLNQAKCAIMLTRADAQGLMSCEMATYGIPVITSNISVCYEIFDDFQNVFFVDNNELETINLDSILNNFSSNISKNRKYFNEVTSQQELDIFNKLI